MKTKLLSDNWPYRCWIDYSDWANIDTYTCPVDYLAYRSGFLSGESGWLCGNLSAAGCLDSGLIDNRLDRECWPYDKRLVED